MIREIKMVIRGKVQGVGFRYYIYRLAKSLNLRGWVANRVDGSVEITVQGEEVNLKELCVQIKSGYGPTLAQVETIETSWGEIQTKFNFFSILDD